MENHIKAMCEEYKEKIIAYRHHLHANPELSFQEKKTSAWIKERLTEAGIPYLDGVSGNSVIGYLEGQQPGKVIAFRADMDALPVEEKNDLPYKSTVPGVMHACGHDSHTAILLGLAEFFADHRELVKGKIKFIFQEAEEMTPGGAKPIVENGFIDDVDCIYALHAMNRPVGTITICEGVATAAMGQYKILIHGKGGHTGMPHLAHDPILTATEVAQAIHQIATVNIDPMSNLTIAVAFLQGGQDELYNVIPETAVLGGTIRALGNDVREKAFENIKALATAICNVRGCTCEMVCEDRFFPSMYNDHEACQRVTRAAKSLGYTVESEPPLLAGEDFAYYQQKCPGAYFNLGADAPDGSYGFVAHNPKLRLDEDAFICGLEIMVGTYLETVGE